jgi:hypothetical protein
MTAINLKSASLLKRCDIHLISNQKQHSIGGPREILNNKLTYNEVIAVSFISEPFIESNIRLTPQEMLKYRFWRSNLYFYLTEPIVTQQRSANRVNRLGHILQYLADVYPNFVIESQNFVTFCHSQKVSLQPKS